MRLEGNVILEPIWFDSMGAKSSSVMIEACGKKIVIDPGIAVMHPSYPASNEEKTRWFLEGYEKIRKTMREADAVIITHYHHDHYLYKLEDIVLYEGKIIFAKNPNVYINKSQRERAFEFYNLLFSREKRQPIEWNRNSYSIKTSIYDVEKSIRRALERDYGEYSLRKKMLLAKGRKWFQDMEKWWSMQSWIPEASFDSTRVVWADGREQSLGCMRIKFTGPLFHGVEYSRLGWVLGVIIYANGLKIIHSSDINGPIIEDYAYMIIKENPDVFFLDGPPTYLLGYTLNKINLTRAVENAVQIIENANRLRLIVYDHHLVREKKFRERTEKVWSFGKKNGIEVVTAAELLGMKPRVLQSI